MFTGVYLWGMKRPATTTDAHEKLIRLQTTRRDSRVDLRVHYAVTRENGCNTYQIISIDEVD